MDTAMLTTTELVALLDRPYAWFETKRRRNREAAELQRVEPGEAFPKVDPDKLDLPVKDIFGGSAWAKYDLEDAFNMALAVELEERGLSFLAASRLTTNTAAAAHAIGRPRNAPDLWIGKSVNYEGATGHFAGEPDEIAKHIAGALTVIMVNASAVLRRLQSRALDLGLAEKLTS
jgi:hypothetical protein